MSFVSPVERLDPPQIADERAALRAWLDYHRATVLRKLDGLDDAQLRQPKVPTGLSLLGLVKHLTDVEHSWFTVRFAREAERHLYSTPEDPDADFRIAGEESTELIVSAYLRECRRSREIEGRAESLDVTFEHPRGGTYDLRWILMHLIEETARHNGHADIIRELIDGATGE